jgi:hypothetical protein
MERKILRDWSCNYLGRDRMGLIGACSVSVTFIGTIIASRVFLSKFMTMTGNSQKEPFLRDSLINE